MRRWTWTGLVCVALGCACIVPRAASQEIAMTEPMREVGFDQHLGEPLPLGLSFRDHTGATVQLGDYFADRPVVLALVYYECPMLCNMVLNGIVTSLRPLKFEPASDFELVVVSFDPGEDAALASAKRDNYLESYDRPETAPGWHFLTGDAASIDSLTQAVGFRYAYDEDTDQFAHASGLVVATPDGTISRYLFGIDFSPKDLRLALVEAGDGQVGGIVEQILLLCYQYDPTTGRYGATIMFFVRLGGVLTVVALVGFILISRRRDRKGSGEVAIP